VREPALSRLCASTLTVLPGALAILAQANLKEHEQHGTAQAQRHKHDREQLTDEVGDRDGADRAGDDECAG
jgi:hypothetical protein